jgi:hypothetical protein
MAPGFSPALRESPATAHGRWFCLWHARALRRMDTFVDISEEDLRQLTQLLARAGGSARPGSGK